MTAEQTTGYLTSSTVSKSICSTSRRSTKSLYGAGWVIDSGATWHMACDRELFSTYVKLPMDHPIRVGDGHMINAIGRGDMLKLSNGQRRKVVKLVDVLHVPALTQNLLSVSLAMELQIDFKFCSSANQCFIVDTLTGTTVGIGTKCEPESRIYFLAEDHEQAHTAQLSPTGKVARDLWHQRYGHLHHAALDTLKRGLVTGLPRIRGVATPCNCCVQAKHTRSPFLDSKHTATTELDIVHSDVCGPIQVQSRGGSRYFLTFIDDCSRYITVYCLPSRDGVLDCFKRFLTEAERQTGRKLKVLRSDNGGEYTSKTFEDYCSSKGVRHETSVPYILHSKMEWPSE